MHQRKIGKVREASLHWQRKAFVKGSRHPLHNKKRCLMPKTKAIIKIQNIVASATLNQKVDLNAVAKSYPTAECRPDRFPGLVF